MEPIGKQIRPSRALSPDAAEESAEGQTAHPVGETGPVQQSSRSLSPPQDLVDNAAVKSHYGQVSAGVTAAPPHTNELALRGGRAAAKIAAVSSVVPTERVSIGGKSYEMTLPQRQRIQSARESLYYYSAFGDSYGGQPLEALDGYLDIGARLSPRGWALFQQMAPLVAEHLDEKTLAGIVVDFLRPETLEDPSAPELLTTRLGSPEAARLLLAEVQGTLDDIAVFKKNSADTFQIFRRTKEQVIAKRDDPVRLAARHEVKRAKKLRAIRAYARAYCKLYRERWSDSFGAAPAADVRQWNKDLKAAQQTPAYRSLSPAARQMLDAQLEYETAGAFYSSYGGLYNRKDRSLVWYAAGPAGISRESFASIQKEFASGGVTFEFRPETNARMYWREMLRPERRKEVADLQRDATTFDTISVGGNRIPEDLNRVYVSDPNLLEAVEAKFVAKLGQEAIDRLGITFHLASEQAALYRSDLSELLAYGGGLGSTEAPRVDAHVVANRTFFLTSEEATDIVDEKRSLYSLLHLPGEDAFGALFGLFRRQSQASARLSKVEAVAYTGARFGIRDDAGRVVEERYLNSAEELFLEGRNSGIVIELRPEVSPAEATRLAESGVWDELDVRSISRIYFASPRDRDRARTAFLEMFGLQSMYRWGLRLESSSNLRQNAARDLAELRQKRGRHTELSLERAEAGQFEPPSLPPLDLSEPASRLRVRDVLLGSQSFGLEAYKNMRDILPPEQYDSWFALQELVVGHARAKTRLSRSVIDAFFAQAATGTTRHQPSGYRSEEKAHEIWPGGVEVGRHWSFELQEAQHYFREPLLELPTELYRTSATSLAVDRIAYAAPGARIQAGLDRIVHAYNQRTDLSPVHRAAMLYKDLLLLHPNTDGNGRAARAILSYLCLREGLPPPMMGRATEADVYLDGDEFLQLISMSLLRGQQAVEFGGPPTGEKFVGPPLPNP